MFNNREDIPPTVCKVSIRAEHDYREQGDAGQRQTHAGHRRPGDGGIPSLRRWLLDFRKDKVSLSDMKLSEENIFDDTQVTYNKDKNRQQTITLEGAVREAGDPRQAEPEGGPGGEFAFKAISASTPRFGE